MRRLPTRIQCLYTGVLLAATGLTACGGTGNSTDSTLSPLPTIVYQPIVETTTTLGAHEALQDDLDADQFVDDPLANVDWEGLAELQQADDEIARQMEIDEARMVYGNCGEWHDLAIAVGWPETEWPTLSRVLYRESRCDPTAFNGSDHGLTQINKIHREWVESMGLTMDDLFDPSVNLAFALDLWESSGWSPWAWLGKP